MQGECTAEEREALALADRLGVPFAMVDPRPISGSDDFRREVLRIQARAFAGWLEQRGFSAVEVTKDGGVCVAGSAPMVIADMRSALVKGGTFGLLGLVGDHVAASCVCARCGTGHSRR